MPRVNIIKNVMKRLEEDLEKLDIQEEVRRRDEVLIALYSIRHSPDIDGERLSAECIVEYIKQRFAVVIPLDQISSYVRDAKKRLRIQ
jgi:hypothetical protein